MKIALINGSPKAKRSSSGVLLSDLKGYFGENAVVEELFFRTQTLPEGTIEKLANADAWVIACPLYVDGVPGHLLSCLVQLEEAHLQKPETRIYGIVNCGFYEGIQAEFALDILKNWSAKAGFVWGGGLGLGGTGGLASQPKKVFGFNIKAPIEKALKALANTILAKGVQENSYCSLAVPRFVYKACVHLSWRRNIRKNGGKTKDLGRIPE